MCITFYFTLNLPKYRLLATAAIILKDPLDYLQHLIYHFHFNKDTFQTTLDIFQTKSDTFHTKQDTFHFKSDTFQIK